MGEKMKAVKSFLFENFLETSSSIGKEFVKNEVKQLALESSLETGVNALLEMTGSAIPAIGPAIASFKNNIRMRNIEKLLEELNKGQLDLENKFQNKSMEEKEILDNIFGMVVDKVSNTLQDEKIKYMVNGYSDILKLENPSFDIAYLYFDTLDKMTILDIEVLKESYPLPIEGQENEQSSTIFERFDIVPSQYKAVQENLYRMGLLENVYDDKLEKDLENIVKYLNEVRGVTKGLTEKASGKKGVRLNKLTNSNLKLKAKDRLKISKFGYDFVEFFIKTEKED